MWKCRSRKCRTPPPAQCTMYASRMMTRITTTSQKKNTTIPGMTSPATLLGLAPASSYPRPPGLSAPACGGVRWGQGAPTPLGPGELRASGTGDNKVMGSVADDPATDRAREWLGVARGGGRAVGLV